MGGILVMLLSVVLLGVCAFLIFLVLSQDTRGGGLAGALGGGAAQSAFGGRSAESVTKLTRWAAIVFFILVLAIGLLNKGSEGLMDTKDGPPAKEAPSGN